MKKGWEIRALKEICVYDKRQGLHKKLPYVGLEHIESNTGRFLGSTEFGDVKSTTFKFGPDHLLYGRLRPYLNKVLAPDFEGHCSTEIFPLKPSSALDRRFLQYWLMKEDTVEAINATCTGARMPRADMNEVLEFEVPVPPLDEQHRIVAILDKAFAAIARAKENAEKNLQNAKELFESELSIEIESLFKAKQSASLLSLSQHITDGDHQPPPKAADGIPFITISNIDKHRRSIDFSNAFRVSRRYFESISPKRVPAPRDILYTVTGSFGIPVLIEDAHEFCFQRHIALIRPSVDTDSTWLSFVLSSKPLFEQASATATGTAQLTVSLKALRELRIPLIELNEQREAAGKWKKLRALAHELSVCHESKLNALNALKKSLLHKAFSGEL